jgi:hypothetical protein
MGHMDDTSRTIKFQVKGKAYTFAPLTEDQQAALLVMPRGIRGVQKVFRILEISLGPEQYDALTDRIIDRDDTLAFGDAAKAVERLLKESAKTTDSDDE